MGTSVSRAALARIRTAFVACATFALALSLAPATSFAADAPMLASSLLDGSAAIVSEDVELVAVDDDAAGATIDPVIGSFTVDGLTFAVNADGVALVSVSPDAVKASAPSGPLAIPSYVSCNGVTYDVTAIGSYAFYLSGATQVALPASISSVDDRAFRSSDVAWVEVAADNPNIASFDGALYSADLSCLLLIPEGRAGSVSIPSEAEVVEASKFSHCSLVDAISVDGDGAAVSSWEGLLYDASGNTLLRVPAGAVDITIREGCTTIAAGAMEGCAKLERINAPASVTSISPNVFESVPTIDLPLAATLKDVEPWQVYQLSTVVILATTSEAPSPVDAAMVQVALSEGSIESLWRNAGFSCLEAALQDGGLDDTTHTNLPADNQEGLGIADLASSQAARAYPTYKVTIYANGHALKRERWVWDTANQSIYTILSTSTLAANSSETAYPTNWHTSIDHVNFDFYNDNYNSNASLHPVTCFREGTPGWSVRGFSRSPNGTAINTGSTNAHFKEAATLYALWQANTYSVGFDANGGSGGQSADVTATFDSAMPAISTTKPTRAGYTFGGWYDTSAATGGTQYYTAAGASARTWNKPNDATLYARWSGNTITCAWNSQGGSSVANTTATYSATTKVPMPSANPTKAGYVFAGWWTAADGGTEVTGETALPTSSPTYHAHWTSAVSADVPLEVTARVDRLGLQEQAEASGYIESRSGAALDVTDAEFEPLAGAATLFGTDAGSVSLVGFPGTSTTPLFTFSLDVAGDESNAGALSPLTMASYGTRIPIRYRFDIPDELLPALTETTLPVCQVSYTVALA